MISISTLLIFPSISISGFLISKLIEVGRFFSEVLISTSLIFLLRSISFVLRLISTFGSSTFGIFNEGPLIFTSGTLTFGFSNFFVPFIIPELIIISFFPLIFKSGLGSFPSILTFGPLILTLFKLVPSIFGSFIFKFEAGISILGGLIWLSILLLPLKFKSKLESGISILLEPLRLISGCSNFIFDDFIFISGWFISNLLEPLRLIFGCSIFIFGDLIFNSGWFISNLLEPFKSIFFVLYPSIIPVNIKSSFLFFIFTSTFGISIFGFSIPFISPSKLKFPFASISGLLISTFGIFKLALIPFNSGCLIEASIFGILISFFSILPFILTSGISVFIFISPEGRSILGELTSKFGILLSILISPEGKFSLILIFGRLLSIFPIISIFGILALISNSGFFIYKSSFGRLVFISNFGLSISRATFSILPSIFNFGNSLAKSIFGILPPISASGKLASISTFGSLIFTSEFGIFTSIPIFGLSRPISAFGIPPSNERFVAFPFKLIFPVGRLISGELIFILLIFLSRSNSFVLRSISTFGWSILKLFNEGLLIIPPIFTSGTFTFVFSNFFVPFIIPELIIISFLPLIFAFGNFPSTLIFPPLKSRFLSLDKLYFGPFIFKSLPLMSNFGELTSIPGSSPFISKPGKLIFCSFMSISPEVMPISGLSILISIFLSESILGSFIPKLGLLIFPFPEISPDNFGPFNFASIFGASNFFPLITPVIFS